MDNKTLVQLFAIRDSLYIQRSWKKNYEKRCFMPKVTKRAGSVILSSYKKDFKSKRVIRDKEDIIF